MYTKEQVENLIAADVAQVVQGPAGKPRLTLAVNGGKFYQFHFHTEKVEVPAAEVCRLEETHWTTFVEVDCPFPRNFEEFQSTCRQVPNLQAALEGMGEDEYDFGGAFGRLYLWDGYPNWIVETTKNGRPFYDADIAGHGDNLEDVERKLYDLLEAESA